MMKELELYIHIPFCVRKCGYCDFLSFPADDKTREEYVEALICEIRLAGSIYSEYKISSVYIGGGTPSLLSAELIKKIGAAFNGAFAEIVEDAEISAECNPGTLTQEKLAAFKEAGVNRLSIGLQSMKDEELQSLGRIHSASDFMQSYETARAAGFENINIDLMQAIPHQTLSGWKETLAAAAELRPEHISAYSLIIEDNTPFRRMADEGELKDLPSEDEEREIYYATREILEKYGYKRYEISNYALPGFECRHNIGYWQRREYLGLGLGASSLVNNVRWRNTDDLQTYMDCVNGKGSVTLHAEEEVLKVTAQMEEFMFLGLRLTEGISKKKFLRSFGRSYDLVYGSVTEKLISEGLISVCGDNVRLTDRGVDLSNVALAEFLQD